MIGLHKNTFTHENLGHMMFQIPWTLKQILICIEFNVFLEKYNKMKLMISKNQLFDWVMMSIYVLNYKS
jgi:hypothetical protein